MPDDRECLRLIRDLLAYLPSNNVDEAPRRATTDPVDRQDEALDTLVPESPNQPYDMHDLVHAIVDDGEFLETFITPVGQVIDWVRQGRITDVKTIIGAFWLEKIISGAWQPGEQAEPPFPKQRAAG